MRMKQHLRRCLTVSLLFCALFGLVICLEDKNVIPGLISGLGLDLPSSEVDENLEEVLIVKCRLELINFKRLYESLGFDIQDESDTSTMQNFNDLNNVKSALRLLNPQTRENLLTCVRDSYLIAPVSGEDVGPGRWYLKHLEFLFPKSYPEINTRRNLAEAPAPAPSTQSPAQTPANTLVDLPTVISPKNAKRTTSPEPDIASNDNNSSHKTVIVAVAVTATATATVTFLVATILFFFCRKYFGGSRFEPKDDRPLLSLSRSDCSGSSPKLWPSENSLHGEKINNQSYFSNASGKPTTVYMNNTLPAESSSVLKPPPGRTGLSSPGLPPLKPPPGRASPLPPLPPASLRPTPGMAAPPPPPPKPPTAPRPPAPRPAAPPPPLPPTKRPTPPPPPGKPGPPPPKSGLASPRPPPVAVKAGSSSDDAESNAGKSKLKPFFWDKVMANPDHSMVWHQIKSGSFQFNEEMIESLFGYAASEKNEKKNYTSPDQPQFIRIIDHKKAQNLCILLRALNVTTEEVRDALQEGTELPSELLETLIKMAPTPQEELKLRLYNGDISQLGLAERFLKVIVDIPFAFRRFEALLFMGTLQEDASTIKESFAILEAACKELRNSRLFLKLLEAVLKTGNRMNDGTFRGGAQAFKLDTLLKLADVKGTDGKTTLLHFVVQEIIRSEGVRAVHAAVESKIVDDTDESEDHYRSLGLQVVSGLGDQLENVKKAACLESNSLTGSIAKLGTSLLKTKKFLNNEMKDVDEDGFHQKLKALVQLAEGEVMRFLEEEKRIMDLVKHTADYFHGKSGQEEGLRLFVIVRDFLIMLEKVCREVKERPSWPTRPMKKDPPTRQSSVETPKTPFSPDYRQRLFPAIAERRMDSSSSDDD